MASEYVILAGEYKLTVRAVDAFITGTYDKRDGTITRPFDADIAALLPYRYRKAFARTNGMFWHDDATHIDASGRMVGGNPPYLALFNYRGAHMVTLCAIPANVTE